MRAFHRSCRKRCIPIIETHPVPTTDKVLIVVQECIDGNDTVDTSCVAVHRGRYRCSDRASYVGMLGQGSPYTTLHSKSVQVTAIDIRRIYTASKRLEGRDISDLLYGFRHISSWEVDYPQKQEPNGSADR